MPDPVATFSKRIGATAGAVAAAPYSAHNTHAGNAIHPKILSTLPIILASFHPAKLKGSAHKNLTMAISKELLDILVCPACKGELELKPDQSGLKCTQCHRLYPIRDDIPVMLIEEATIEE